jgi:hypothetical protein
MILVAPVEFANVPSGLYISNQSLSSVGVEMRGNAWLMNPMIPSLTLHVDVSGFGEGWRTIRLDSSDLNLPPGVRVERISPKSISLQLVRRVAQ